MGLLTRAAAEAQLVGCCLIFVVLEALVKESSFAPVALPGAVSMGTAHRYGPVLRPSPFKSIMSTINGSHLMGIFRF